MNKVGLDKSISITKKEWLIEFYNQVGREVSTARESQRETHNWVITITGGAIAAIWAFSGENLNYPTESSFIAVLIILPLVFRFFVRSCLEYQIFNRWIAIRNALDIFFYAQNEKPEIVNVAERFLMENIRSYYFQWKQPKTCIKMIWDNIQLAFGWPFIITLAMVVLGFLCQPFTPFIVVVFILVTLWMIFEIINFVRYFSRKYQKVQPSINIKTLEIN